MVHVQRMFNVPDRQVKKRGLNRVRTDLQVVDLHPSHIIVERAGLANKLGRKCTG